MKKQTEIDILQSLKEDTYFSQCFGAEDIDTMCANIKNDFPIEMGCKFNARVEALERKLEGERNMIRNYVTNILAATSPENLTDELVNTLTKMAGSWLKFIKCKFYAGHNLSASETRKLIEMASESTQNN